MISKESFSRIHIISAVTIFVAVLFIIKLFFVQILYSSTYREKADRQYATPSGSIFERGAIYFSTKTNELVSAATLQTGYKVAIHPKEILDKEATYRTLVEFIPELSQEEFTTKAEKSHDPYEEIATKLTKEQADGIAAQKIAGVDIYKEKWRFYPGGALFSHGIGFVGFKGKELAGRYGLERFYNDTLSRKKDTAYVNFFAEVFTNITDRFFENQSKEGDVVLSIEPSVQNFLETTLGGVDKKWQSAFSGGIILDPKTGAIYAMALSPDFNINQFQKEESVDVFQNKIVESVFEAGSVVKPLVMAAALDAGVVTPKTTYTDKGFIDVDDRTFSNFDKVGRGPNTSMQDVLTQSLNTGMVFVMQKLGKEKFREYMFNYDLAEKTGIDLPNEITGLLSNLKTPSNVAYATASFGQGIAITPIAEAKAFASLANGGYLITPHVVKQVRYTNGTKKDIVYEKGRQVLKPETSEAITRMLTVAFDTNVKEHNTLLSHYSIAGKTGTAQVAKEQGGGYYDDKHFHSFFGYFPAHDPRFLVVLFTSDPKGVKFASQTLIPPFTDVARFLISYYDIPPDR